MTGDKSHREIDDDYCREIARFGEYRLIDGACGIQWVIQKQDGKTKSGGQRWTGRSYARRRETIIRLCREFGGLLNPEVQAILEELPDRHPRWGVMPETINEEGMSMLPATNPVSVISLASRPARVRENPGGLRPSLPGGGVTVPLSSSVHRPSGAGKDITGPCLHDGFADGGFSRKGA
jgi:hypothetical protein